MCRGKNMMANREKSAIMNQVREKIVRKKEVKT